MHKTSWSKRKLILYSLLACCIFLLVLESAFRIYFWSEMKNIHSSVYIQGNTIQMDDSVLVFRNRPFYLDYDRRFQHNEKGMRSQPGDVWMPKKDSSDYWVFLFGASSMEGMGSNKDGEWLDITGVTDYRYNENIAFYLQQYLQEKIPDKKVRVFNAANTSYTIEQSYLRYLQLASQYKMDWVISMDGQNNPPALAQGVSVLEEVKTDWQHNPSRKFPLKLVIPLTSHSVFINSFKQYLFHIKQSARLTTNIKNNFPRRDYWVKNNSPSLLFKKTGDNTRLAVELFYQQLLQFDSSLTARNQKHLLLVQPHLIFRDTLLMNETEKALLRYYQHAFNNPWENSFLKQLREEFSKKVGSTNTSVQLLNQTDTLGSQVFVDYCHFTSTANRFIAHLILQHILAETRPSRKEAEFGFKEVLTNLGH